VHQEDVLKKAIIENPDSLDAQFNLYQFYLEQPISNEIEGEAPPIPSSQKVEAALRADIQREPDIGEYVFWLADLFDSQMRYSEAVELLKTFLEGHPHHAEALNFLAALYIDHQSEDPEAEAKAIPLLRQAIALDPNFHTPYYNLGYLMMRGKRNQEAIACFEQALILDPKDFKTYNNLGSLYQLMGDFSKALSCFQKAVKLKPEYYLGYFNLGVTHLKLHNGQSAQEAFEQAVALNPNDCFSYRELAKLYQSQWKLKPAIQAFRKYHKLLDALKTEQERKRALQTRAAFGAVLLFIILGNGFSTLESPTSYEKGKDKPNDKREQRVMLVPQNALMGQNEGSAAIKTDPSHPKGYCKDSKMKQIPRGLSQQKGMFQTADPCDDTPDGSLP
ncbi:MAG: tetratricopeptide repeat protein, partial [Cyanobacteria bacterium]|nr:tetratricopeptide repeat protein [Cyanobacteriota bacterium]